MFRESIIIDMPRIAKAFAKPFLFSRNKAYGTNATKVKPKPNSPSSKEKRRGKEETVLEP